MNQKKAKQLRKFAQSFHAAMGENSSANTIYVEDKNTRRTIDTRKFDEEGNQISGFVFTKNGVIRVKESCLRGIYRSMKKEYRKEM